MRCPSQYCQVDAGAGCHVIIRSPSVRWRDGRAIGGDTRDHARDYAGRFSAAGAACRIAAPSRTQGSSGALRCRLSTNPDHSAGAVFTRSHAARLHECKIAGLRRCRQLQLRCALRDFAAPLLDWPNTAPCAAVQARFFILETDTVAPVRVLASAPRDTAPRVSGGLSDQSSYILRWYARDGRGLRRYHPCMNKKHGRHARRGRP